MSAGVRIEDPTEDELRRSMVLKWGTVAPGVIPAWVAETDYRLAPVVAEALQRAVTDGVTGYPADEVGEGPLGEAYAGFAERRFGWRVDPSFVLPVADVTAGVRLAIDLLSAPGALALPVPAYSPQLGLGATTGRDTVAVPFVSEQGRAVIDLDALDAALGAGASTLVLTNPHNPCGTCPTRAELEAVRDVVVRHGARVVSDEIHAPLTLAGAEHVPYLSLEGTADHAVAVVAASKAFNTPALRCAQVVAGDEGTARRLASAPKPQNSSWSELGVRASTAAYEQGDDWLDALLVRLDQQRTLLTERLATDLPLARVRPLEATYLAWLDLRAYGHDDPAAVALERGRVRLAPGHDYHPGLAGHVRLNAATSPERLVEIVRRLGVALA
ncbi:cystathionine beta-lyase [Marmoricola endophyticus]|uniref:cysteine-S-conjugate beta-lyase n=1 Tax=Marmoricola endophyticus TaxID=2040280 RepID=A0A917F141_9ACTN|nr:aminotransferase class I/II-fold pyridoxal phosphate-dependent enzyme [Marmoricola endophyticus]GGF41820.1 cystathionine beta-lyase [Marmoricola endophyticus]